VDDVRFFYTADSVHGRSCVFLSDDNVIAKTTTVYIDSNQILVNDKDRQVAHRGQSMLSTITSFSHEVSSVTVM